MRQQFSRYISRQWKELSRPYTENGVINNDYCKTNKNFIDDIDILLCDINKRISDKSNKFVVIASKSTISHEIIENSLHFVLPEQLCENAIVFARSRIISYNDNKHLATSRKSGSPTEIIGREEIKQKGTLKMIRAGLIFAPLISERQLRSENKNVSGLASLYLTAVIEYLSSDIIDTLLSSNTTLKNILETDIEMKILFSNYLFINLLHFDKEFHANNLKILSQYNVRITRNGSKLLKSYFACDRHCNHSEDDVSGTFLEEQNSGNDSDRSDDEPLDSSDLNEKLKGVFNDCIIVNYVKKKKVISEETILNVLNLRSQKLLFGKV